jgi:hypothetical protein
MARSRVWSGFSTVKKRPNIGHIVSAIVGLKLLAKSCATYLRQLAHSPRCLRSHRESDRVECIENAEK